MERGEYFDELRDSVYVMHRCSRGPYNARFHFHEDYEIYLFLEGDARLYVEQTVHQLVPGSLAVFNDKEIHRACCLGDGPYERMAIHFNPNLVSGLSTPGTNLLGCFLNHRAGEGNVILPDPEKREEIFRLGKELETLSAQSGYGADVLTLACLSRLLVYINLLYRQLTHQKPAIFDRTVEQVMDFVESHLTEELSLERLASRFALDRYYLSHLFRQQTGDSLYHYILTKRVARARQYLAEGRSVTEVCALTGFNDYSNFIRTFKKQTGISPGKYGGRKKNEK